MKDIFNMDETGLFFRLQPDHSLATMQLEGKKQDVLTHPEENVVAQLLTDEEIIESIIGIN
ncbi:hypothetical protein Tco_0539232, partial [Tanacetum coccineum]